MTSGSTNGSWGQMMSGSPQQQETEELGSWLSSLLHCPVHHPAFGKDIFECGCGILFPKFVVKGHDAEAIKNLHDTGYKPDSPKANNSL